jgi:hypothetical protein
MAIAITKSCINVTDCFKFNTLLSYLASKQADFSVDSKPITCILSPKCPTHGHRETGKGKNSSLLMIIPTSKPQRFTTNVEKGID